MQVEFVRQLAAVVNSGIRVMLTTHSEWVLDELTNLVRLSDLPETRREDIASADFALKSSEVGVWLFEPKQRPKGSVVKEIPFDEEFGGFRSGFDEVAMGTYNDYAKISNRIERSSAHDESH
jgi:predicted ATPase